MADPATKQDVQDLDRIVIILGGTIAGLVIVTIITIIISLVCVSRLFKKLNNLSFTIKSVRLDVRKTLEAVKTANKVNPIIDEDDGSERVSPIFTRKMFTPSPLPFDLSVLRESDYEYDRDSRARKNPHVVSSNARTHNHGVKGPPVPPRRVHSFYGDY